MSCKKTLLSLALLGAAATGASAQSLDRVEVMGQRVRADVSASCPNVAADIVSALAPAVYRLQKEGSYTVSFELSADEVGSVRTAYQAPDEYRRALRQAVRALDCRDAASHQQAQRFGFVVDVRMNEAASGGAARVAMSFRALD